VIARAVGERKTDRRDGKEDGVEKEGKSSQSRAGSARRRAAGRTMVRIVKRMRTVKLGAVESSSLPRGQRITDEEIYDSPGIFVFRAFQWGGGGGGWYRWHDVLQK